MIDVKELRIGSHIMHKSKRFRIEFIYGELVGINVGNDEKTGKSVAGIPTDELDPIPLTAGLLQEIGFEPVRKTLGKPEEEWNKEIDGYPIRVMKGYSNNPQREWSVHIDSWDYDTIGSADVAYLHQLEGIIYLCTNCELIKED